MLRAWVSGPFILYRIIVREEICDKHVFSFVLVHAITAHTLWKGKKKSESESLRDREKMRKEERNVVTEGGSHIRFVYAPRQLSGDCAEQCNGNEITAGGKKREEKKKLWRVVIVQSHESLAPDAAG